MYKKRNKKDENVAGPRGNFGDYHRESPVNPTDDLAKTPRKKYAPNDMDEEMA